MVTYLESYNEAVTFSSGKGLAHTLARRAGFLLQTSEHMLALRDLHLGNRGQIFSVCCIRYFLASAGVRVSGERAAGRAAGAPPLPRRGPGHQGRRRLGEEIRQQVRGGDI